MRMTEYIEPEGNCEGKSPIEAGNDFEVLEEEAESENKRSRDYASEGEITAALEIAFKSDPNLYSKLKFKALKWIRFYFHKERMDEYTAEEIIPIAIISLYEEKGRKWYREKTPKIENLLLMVIPSIIRNYKKKKKFNIVGIDIYNNEGELNEANITDLLRAYVREDLKDELFRDELEDLIAKLLKLLKKDSIGTKVLEQLLEINHAEIKKPEIIIAQNLNIAEGDVKKAIRRIDRKIDKLCAK